MVGKYTYFVGVVGSEAAMFFMNIIMLTIVMYTLRQRRMNGTARFISRARCAFASNILNGTTLICNGLDLKYTFKTFEISWWLFSLLHSLFVFVFYTVPKQGESSCNCCKLSTNEERLLPGQPTRNKISALSEKQLSGEAVEERISLGQLKLKKQSAFSENDLSEDPAVQQLTSNKPNIFSKKQLSENSAEGRTSLGRTKIEKKNEFSENLLSEGRTKKRILMGHQTRKKPSVLYEKQSSADAIKERILLGEPTRKKPSVLSKNKLSDAVAKSREGNWWTFYIFCNILKKSTAVSFFSLLTVSHVVCA